MFKYKYSLYTLELIFRILHLETSGGKFSIGSNTLQRSGGAERKYKLVYDSNLYVKGKTQIPPNSLTTCDNEGETKRSRGPISWFHR